jgi:hypothetical protein
MNGNGSSKEAGAQRAAAVRLLVPEGPDLGEHAERREKKNER